MVQGGGKMPPVSQILASCVARVIKELVGGLAVAQQVAAREAQIDVAEAAVVDEAQVYAVDYDALVDAAPAVCGRVRIFQQKFVESVLFDDVLARGRNDEVCAYVCNGIREP